jgi:hypothetical protein
VGVRIHKVPLLQRRFKERKEYTMHLSGRAFDCRRAIVAALFYFGLSCCPEIGAWAANPFHYSKLPRRSLSAGWGPVASNSHNAVQVLIRTNKTLAGLTARNFATHWATLFILHCAHFSRKRLAIWGAVCASLFAIEIDLWNIILSQSAAGDPSTCISWCL